MKVTIPGHTILSSAASAISSRIVSDARRLMSPEQLTLAEEVEPQHLRDGEHPLGVADVLDHLVRKKRSHLGAPLGSTRRAQPTCPRIENQR